MTNKEILNNISILESVLYYRLDGSDDRENVSYTDLETAHNAANNLLKFWHRVTGETL